MSIDNLDAPRLARINELCHRITVCDTRGARVWICEELKREIQALNDDRLERLANALNLVSH